RLLDALRAAGGRRPRRRTDLRHRAEGGGRHARRRLDLGRRLERAAARERLPGHPRRRPRRPGARQRPALRVRPARLARAVPEPATADAALPAHDTLTRTGEVMWNAECGVRNAESRRLWPGSGLTSSRLFRIPHSALRTRARWP